MNLVTIKCVVCNEDFSIPSQINCKNPSSLHSLVADLWNLFCQLYKVSKKDSTNVIQSYMAINQCPFCPPCRQNVCRILVYNEKVKSYQDRIRKIATILTQTIIESSSVKNNNLNHRPDQPDPKKLLINNMVKEENTHHEENGNSEKTDTVTINQRINCLRSNILKNFSPRVLLIDCEQGRQQLGIHHHSKNDEQQLTTIEKTNIPLQLNCHNNNYCSSSSSSSSFIVTNNVEKMTEKKLSYDEQFIGESMEPPITDLQYEDEEEEDPLGFPTECKRMKMTTYEPESVHHTEDHVMDHKSMETFVRTFKTKRIELGVTQMTMGDQLRKLYNVDLSQTTMSRFEGLNLTFPNMCKLQPVFAKWMEDNGGETGTISRNCRPLDPSLFTIGRRKKRTFFDQQVLIILKKSFRQNSFPDSSQVDALASHLKLDREVIRVWFCNQRKLTRQKVHGNPSSSSADVSPSLCDVAGLTSNLSRSFYSQLLGDTDNLPPDHCNDIDIDDTTFSWTSSHPQSSSSSSSQTPLIKMEKYQVHSFSN